MLRIKLKFITLNKDKIKNTTKLDRSYYFEIEVSNEKLKSSSGLYNQHFYSISWHHQPLNFVEFQLKSKNSIKLSLFEESTSECVANAKLILQEEDVNLTKSICLTLTSTKSKTFTKFLTNKFDFNDSKLFIVISFFNPLLTANKLVGNNDLKVHLKLYELYTSEGLNKKCLIEVKINKYRNTKMLNLNEKFNEYLIISIKHDELFDGFLEIFLYEQRNTFEHQTTALATFTYLLYKIYDQQKHGLSNKWLELNTVLDTKIYLKVSIYINSNYNLPIDENNNESFSPNHCLPSDNVHQISNNKNHFVSITFYYADFFNSIYWCLDQLECKIKFKCDTRCDEILVKIDGIKFCKEFGVLVINREFVFKTGQVKYTEIVFEFIFKNHQLIHASIERQLFEDPILVNLKHIGKIIGHLLVKFDLFYEDVAGKNENLELFKVNFPDWNIGELIEKYLKKCNYTFLIVLNDICHLPKTLSDAICISCRTSYDSNNFSQTEFYKAEENIFLSYRNIKWQIKKPILLLKFKWLDQFYRISVLNFIENSIDRFIKLHNTVKPTDMLDELVKIFKSHDYLKNQIDLNIEKSTITCFDNYIDNSVLVEKLREIINYIKSNLNLPEIQIDMRKRRGLGKKSYINLYHTSISLSHAYISNLMGRHTSDFDRFQFEKFQKNHSSSFYNPVLHAKSYLLTDTVDFLSFCKNNFIEITSYIGKQRKRNIFENKKVEFLFEVEKKIDNLWKTIFFIDKSGKKYRKLKDFKLKRKFLWINDWFLDTGWYYATNLNQSVWLDYNSYLMFKYRRRKWIRIKDFLKKTPEMNKKVHKLKINENIFVTQLNDIFQKQKISAVVKSSIKTYTFNIKIIEVKIFNNILLNFTSRNFTKSNNSCIFYSLKFFIFDKEKTLVSETMSKNLNLIYCNLNPRWNRALNFKIDIPDRFNRQIKVLAELQVNFINRACIQEVTIAMGTFNFESSSEKHDLLNFHNHSNDETSCLVLAELSLLEDKNVISIKNDFFLLKFTKNVYIMNFGLRFKHEFFKFYKDSANLDLVFVLNGRLFISKVCINENYAFCEDKNNEIKFENISFYKNSSILSNTLDIYLCFSSQIDYSTSKALDKIIGFNRINNIYECNSKFYKPFYETNNKLLPIKKHDFYLKKLVTMRLKNKKTVKIQPKSEFNENIIETEIDFWTRFYNSLNSSNSFYNFNILNSELENEHEGLDDHADSTVEILNFKKKNESLGQLKMKLLISDTPSFYKPCNILPSICIIRLYIIKAFNLKGRINDSGHITANPYLQIICTGHNHHNDIKIDSRADVIKDSLSPEFGEYFEFQVNIPEKSELEIVLIDRNVHKFHHDSVIGITKIQLENRLTSEFRATCGLPVLYYEEAVVTEHSKTIISLLVWRDIIKPSEILKHICHLNQLRCLLNETNFVIEIENDKIGLADFEIDNIDELYMHTTNLFEQQCLNVLNTKFKLIKEHIETRTLYSKYSKEETGKIHLWLDLFPIDNKLLARNIPHPINIQIRRPTSLELRCIVWNVIFLSRNYNLIHESKNVFLKSWISECDVQKSDTHFHCTAKANFNYRFVFEFDYLWQEKCLIKSSNEFPGILSIDEFMSKNLHLKKNPNHVSNYEHDKHVPKINFEIFTTDLLGIHPNVLSRLELNLNELNVPFKVEPKKYSNGCFNIDNLKKILNFDDKSNLSLFKIGSINGWWPCKGNQVKSNLDCFINMSLEVLNLHEAKLRPAGKGRDDPNINPKLDEPEREPFIETSLLNPYNKLVKFFKHIFLMEKSKILKYLFYICIIVFGLLCVWSIPSVLVSRIIKRII
jgi:hypothetical protein